MSHKNCHERIAGQTEWMHADNTLEIMAKRSLIQVVNGPTRIQGQCQTAIDLIFLFDQTFGYTFDIKGEISDHKIAVASLIIKHAATNSKLKL